MPERDIIPFMGISIDNLSMEEAIGRIKECIDENKRMYVVTPNVDHIVKLQKNDAFVGAYNEAGMVAVDGTPIMVAAKLYNTPLKEKLTGPRLTEHTIELAAKNHLSVFILGGFDGAGDEAARNLAEKYPGFVYAGGYGPPYGFEKDEAETKKIIGLINAAKPDIIIAGMGTPRTELFLQEHYQEMDMHVALSVGAAIDFFAGRVKRCPAWVNKIGMEWFYRFLKEPRRMFKRYFIDDVAFLGLLFKYRPRDGKDT